MKRLKMIITAIAVLATVSGALAFKSSARFSSGSVYCTNTCATSVAFKVDPNGTNTIPCGTGNQPYIYNASSVCTATIAGTTFHTTTDAGK